MSSTACPACGGPLGAERALRGIDRLHGVEGEFEVLVCPACGTGRTRPHVAAEELGELYPPDYTAYAFPPNPVLRLLAVGLSEARYRRALRSEPLRRLRSRGAGRLLDVGSGRGDLAAALQRHGWEVVGLEPSGSARDEAVRRGVNTILGTLQAPASELGGPYDVVVFNHALEHVVEPSEDVQIARSLLLDDGLVLVLAPNFASWQRRRFGTYWFHLDLPRHRSHFTPKGLASLLQNAGFADVTVGTSGTADGLPMSVQYRLFGRRRFDSGIGRYAAVAATLAATPVTALANRAAGEGDVVHAVAANVAR
jgi:SAM-dependent methyltransferase